MPVGRDAGAGQGTSTGSDDGEEGAVEEGAQMPLAEWKSQQMKKKAQSTRERLRDEYAKQAAHIKLGDRCEIGGYKGEVAFLGDEIEGLPGGVWIGIRYDQPVGKNDGTVKGRRLFHCHPNCGHLVRPDKVLEGAIDLQADRPVSARPSSLATSRPRSPVSPSRCRPTITAPTAEELLARPNSMTLTAPVRVEVESTHEPPRARSVSPTRSPVLVTKREEPGNRRYEKYQNVDPDTIIGTDPKLDETLPRHRTGLVYDTRMEAHRSTGAFHPEQPLRITAIFATLADQGLAQRCCRVPARNATEAELVAVHTAQHVQNICNLGSKSQGDLNEMASNLDSVYLCPQSGNAALLASGSVVEATRMVCQGKIASACCIVRPPGHHATPSCAMGFCLFGNVAVAAKEARRRGWAQRVLIFDWDVHHGNGTQKMFWEDDSVLCFSVHRYDRGNFYPGGPEGNNDWVGEGDGQGYNVNVPWPKSGAGDDEYRAVVDQLLLPIAKEYKPDLVLISAGFDAAQGDPLGGCHITPEGYHMMTKACKELANGKVVIALEGGYSLRATAQSMAACVSALLDPSKDVKPANTGLEGSSSAPSSPPVSAGSLYLDAIEATRKIQAHFWKNVRQTNDVLDYSAFRSNTPERLPSRATKSATVGAKGTGGWEIKRELANASSQRTALSSPATPAGPDFCESKSQGCTPSTASRKWKVSEGKMIEKEKAPAPASSPSPADSSASTDASSRSSSIASSPATPAVTSAPRASAVTSGWRPVGRNNNVNSVGSRGSGGSARSWQDLDDSD